MLLSLKIENFRSIGGEIELNLEPVKSVKEFPKYVRSFANGKYQLLNAAVIYGANASGKSNIIRAFRFIENFVMKLRRGTAIEILNKVYTKFKLREKYNENETKFEIEFLSNEIKYRYSFSITLKNDAIEVVSENLYKAGKQREVLLFERKGEKYKIGNSYPGVKHLIPNTRSDTLFVSVCDQFNIEEAVNIILWFKKINFIDDDNVNRFGIRTSQFIYSEKYKSEILDFLLKMNTDIKNISMEKVVRPLKDLPEEMQNQVLKTTEKIPEAVSTLIPFSSHSFYNNEGFPTEESINFKMEDFESDGTQKAYNLAGAIVPALLESRILVIDELEAGLHPSLVRYIVLCFLLNERNKENQLIFTTHDSHLIDKELFRPDQIYFAEKNNWESTTLFSLVDYKQKELSKIKDYENAYLEGKFGGVPYIHELPDFLFNKTEKS